MIDFELWHGENVKSKANDFHRLAVAGLTMAKDTQKSECLFCRRLSMSANNEISELHI